MTNQEYLQIFRCMVRFAGLQAPGDDLHIVGPYGTIEALDGKLRVLMNVVPPPWRARMQESPRVVSEFKHTDLPAGAAAMINIGLAELPITPYPGEASQ